jgi:hypothetical protein
MVGVRWSWFDTLGAIAPQGYVAPYLDGVRVSSFLEAKKNKPTLFIPHMGYKGDASCFVENLARRHRVQAPPGNL